MNCQSIRNKLAEYHQGKLSFEDYKHVNEHIQTCDSCAKKLAAYIEKKNYQESTPEQRVGTSPVPTPVYIPKTRNRNLKIMLAVFVFLVSVVIITSDDNLLEKIGIADKPAFGEKVAVSSKNNNIEFTVTHAAADNERTILFFEIKGLQSDYPIFIDHEGINVVEKDIWTVTDFKKGGTYITNVVKKAVTKGRFYLPELVSNENTITLQIPELFRLKDQDIEPYSDEWFDEENRVVISGDWQVEIPVQKHQKNTFELNETVEVNGVLVEIGKLILSPTISVLDYNYERDNSNEHNRQISLSHLEVAGERYEIQQNYGDSVDHKGIHQQSISFDGLFYQQPKEIEVHFKSMMQYVANQVKVGFDHTRLPYTFTYLDEPITIEKVEIGDPTRVIIKEEFRENRAFQQLTFDFDYFRFNGNKMHQINITSNGVWVDQEGNILEEIPPGNKHNSYRYFTTEHQVEIYLDDDGNPFIPDFLFIEGYRNETNLDEKITIELKSDLAD